MATNQLVNLRSNEISNNKENIRLVWLDENMNNSLDSLPIQNKLREFNPAVQFYSDFNRCFDLIKSIKDEHIFLIYSGNLIQHFSILTQIYNHQNLLAIFILTDNHQDHDSFLTKYNKIVGIFSDRDILLNSIQEKLNLFEKQKLELKLFDQEQTTLKDLSKESRDFVWHQILIRILKELPRDELSIQQIIDMCKSYYQNNKELLKKIEEFKENYTHENGMKWFTNESFIYKLLNKAFCIDDLEVLYTFRSFIIDLCEVIEQKSHHLKDKGMLKLYCGTQMSLEKIQKLKENIGKIISTNGFLLTSRCIENALQSARSKIVSNDFHSVLIEIQVDSSLKTVSFANGEDNDVLFNLNVLFKIHSVHFDATLNLWKIQLNTTDEGTEKIEECLLLSRDERKQSSSSIIRMGRILKNGLKKINHTEKYFHSLLRTLPSNHSDIADIYLNIGIIHFDRNELDLALKNYEKAYELQEKGSLSDDCITIEILWSIALVYSKQCQYDLALDYYQKTLDIAEKYYPKEHIEKAKILANIGRVYGNKDEFDTAFSYSSRALDMYRCVYSEEQHDIALCLGQIGYIFERKGDFKMALDYYYQQLSIDEKCLSFDHPDLITVFHLIINIYTKMNEKEKVLEFCQEKLNIQNNQSDSDDSHTIRRLMIIADLLKPINPTKSLEYYEKARSILEKSIPSDLQTISQCLTSIASLYAYFSMLDKALECELKVYDLHRQILISDHPDIATNLRNIGIGYAKINKPSEILRYFNESLSIFITNFGEEHGEVKRLQTDINKIKNIIMFTTTQKTNKKNSKGKFHH